MVAGTRRAVDAEVFGVLEVHCGMRGNSRDQRTTAGARASHTWWASSNGGWRQADDQLNAAMSGGSRYGVSWAWMAGLPCWTGPWWMGPL